MAAMLLGDLEAEVVKVEPPGGDRMKDHPGYHAWMPPYGTSGRWSGIAPHHSLLAGLTGTAFRQGAYADQPVHLILPVLWYGQAVMGAAAIGSALYERTRSGRGQGVVVSGLHGASEASGVMRLLDQ